MSKVDISKATPRPWIVEGTLVYALEQDGWRGGKPAMIDDTIRPALCQWAEQGNSHARLSRFRHLQPGNEVQLTSAWMSIDEVDFNQEPFDCAVLLSDGHFPADWEASYLFPELLIPVGAPVAIAELEGVTSIHDYDFVVVPNL